MNERITQLALEASDPKTGWLDRKKFTKLIVRECLLKVNGAKIRGESMDELIERIKEDFGVEE